ncbi:hypothetical protein L1987_64717 [Smallanthus sonchifolius]|uniref:Uncharacterized protein n=1 Tax=Smallanthus sonchifolius TaxID=185202 RepID=A0ACB9BSH9_9ASTR|nr:hypothetical protein L1987_64717 [Smallanthus sonchifolius]
MNNVAVSRNEIAQIVADQIADAIPNIVAQSVQMETLELTVVRKEMTELMELRIQMELKETMELTEIRGMTKSANPTTLDEAVELSRSLTDETVHTGVLALDGSG